MDYDLFFNGDPILAESYRIAHRYRIQEENQRMWINGIYIMDAVGTLASNMLSKGNRKKYMERPLDILPKTREEKEREKDETRRRVIDTLTRFQNTFNNKE